MRPNFRRYIIVIYSAVFAHLSASAFEIKVKIPDCPKGSQKFYMPDEKNPNWIACKDDRGWYQGLLIQFSQPGEILRIAGMKDSLRHGREIRFGEVGFMEERAYVSGHLSGDSLIYKCDSVLGRVLPKNMTPKDWQSFLDHRIPPVLGIWLKQDQPYSTARFENGRLTRLQFEKKDYEFKVSPEGRIFAQNHPEMKELFFVDPIPMWNLGSDDLRRLLLPGFGSCKKYAGPIGRFGRHYDHHLFVREKSEKKHIENLTEIRHRFIKFCVPEDVRDHLGSTECPPQLPGMLPPNRCLLPVSDQLKIPYLPKYFKFEYMIGRSPEDFIQLLGEEKVLRFLSDPDEDTLTVFVKPKWTVVVKKQLKRVVYRVLKGLPENAKVSRASLEGKDWWEWHPLPGNE